MDLAEPRDPQPPTVTSYATVEIQTGAAPRPFHYREGTCDASVIKQIFADHDYALNRLRRFADIQLHLERKRAQGLRPLIVDAGANIGASPVYFSLNFSDAMVIAVEPDMSNFQLLARNAAGLPIRTELAAVAAREGRMQVVDPGESFWGFRTAAVDAADVQAGGFHVPSLPMNALYESGGPGVFPFIAKIDIEGGEADLFSANTEWVGKTPVLIIELHDWMLPKQRTSAAFLKCIADQDRDFVHVGENIFSIANDLESL